ncbi:MAG: VOC family protein [Planctomycetota bacterium]|jgi:predicted enzyme related to lactoylglutathione lyase
MALQIGFLEIVTSDVEATCAGFAQTVGVTFGDPVPTMGGARIAELAGGGRVGVRAPMHETEGHVVRPYWLTTDIQAAWSAALEAGAAEMHPPMELPGEGWFAIYQLGGNQHALWQN